MRPNKDTGGVEFENSSEVAMARRALRLTGFERLASTIDLERDWLSLGPLESDLVIQGLVKFTSNDLSIDYDRASDMLADYHEKSSVSTATSTS